MAPFGEGWDMPVEYEGWSDFHWWKVPSSRVLVMVCLSELPVWYAGHFFHGRMEPCQGDGCKLCADGVGSQARYILVCAEPLTRKVGLLEVSRAIALELRDIGDARGGCRGMVFEIGKHTRHKQSRMEVRGCPDDMAGAWQQYEVPDVKKALILTWEKAGFDVPEKYRAATAENPRSEPPTGRKSGETARQRENRGRSEPPRFVPQGTPDKGS